MIGGVNIPPVEATASTAPAKWLLKPIFFMRGMVKLPVVTTFATGEPDIIPKMALLMTAVKAGPPRNLPTAA
jgi:hypothetical protein